MLNQFKLNFFFLFKETSVSFGCGRINFVPFFNNSYSLLMKDRKKNQGNINK